jgi:hypothetical protein
MEECIICFEETTQFVFFPCAHKVCAECRKQIHRCPICNYAFDQEEVRPRVQIVQLPSSTCSRMCGLFVLTFLFGVAYQTLTHSEL